HRQPSRCADGCAAQRSCCGIFDGVRRAGGVGSAAICLGRTTAGWNGNSRAGGVLGGGRGVRRKCLGAGATAKLVATAEYRVVRGRNFPGSACGLAGVGILEHDGSRRGYRNPRGGCVVLPAACGSGILGAMSERGKLANTLSLLRSLLIFVPLIYLYTGVLGTVSLLASLFDRDGRVQHSIARLWARMILATVLSPVKVSGLEQLDGSRARVYAANHLSALDIPILYAHL